MFSFMPRFSGAVIFSKLLLLISVLEFFAKMSSYLIPVKLVNCLDAIAYNPLSLNSGVVIYSLLLSRHTLCW